MFNNCLLYNAKKLERQLSLIVEEEFENINFHHTYAYILTVISSNKYVKTKDISLELSLDSSTVTRMVSKLQSDGYVVKGSESSPVDISLSPKGKDVMKDINRAWDRYHLKCSELLTQKGYEQLNKYLIEVNNKLSK